LTSALFIIIAESVRILCEGFHIFRLCGSARRATNQPPFDSTFAQAELLGNSQGNVGTAVHHVLHMVAGDKHDRRLLGRFREFLPRGARRRPAKRAEVETWRLSSAHLWQPLSPLDGAKSRVCLVPVDVFDELLYVFGLAILIVDVKGMLIGVDHDKRH